MIQETCAYIAVGSNIDPLRNIPCCLELLRMIPNSRLTRESSWYLTSPWGLASQPDFINLVIALATRLSPHQLLGETQAIETRLERLREIKNGPRTIDLDLLLFGDTILATRDLRDSASRFTAPGLHAGTIVRDCPGDDSPRTRTPDPSTHARDPAPPDHRTVATARSRHH